MSDLQFSRRNFVKTTAATAAAISAAPTILKAAPKKDGETINIALIGCGGRGRGAAANAMNADKNVRLIAMADVFPDKLEKAVSGLKGYGDRAKVEEKNIFIGFDAYKQVMAMPEVDMVILTTPPHFRSIHIEAAVAANKHIFAEKPLACDPAGLKRVMKAVEECKKKGLTFVCGFCYRFDKKKIDTMAEVAKGAIGDVLNVQCSYNTGGLWMHQRQDGWGDMEWQMRNWLYFTWLSGDHIVEQGIHNVDKLCWAAGDSQIVEAYGQGGRQSRTDGAYGHVYDHFAIQYKFENGLVGNFTCRQQKGTDASVSDLLIGTKGRADLMRHFIMDKDGKRTWRFKGKSVNMYDAEHIALFQGIRSGNVVNNGSESCNSTAAGIMGRMSAYTGKRVTWKMFMESTEDLSPKVYDLKADLETPEVARPGITKFV